MLHHPEPIFFLHPRLRGHDQGEDNHFFVENLPDFEPVQKAWRRDFGAGGKNNACIANAVDIFGRLRELLKRHDAIRQLSTNRPAGVVPRNQNKGYD